MRNRSGRKRLMTLCLGLLLLLTTAIPVFAAAEELPRTRTDTIRMGYFEFGGMFGGAEEGAKKSGYCYEYMMQIATYTGWKYEFCYGSYAELYEKLKTGEIDILPYTNYNEQRGREVLFSDKALAEEESYIAVQSDRGTTLDDLNGAVISTLEGADYKGLLLDFIEQNGLELDVRYYPDLNDTWDAACSGETAAAVFTSNAYSDEGWDCLCSFGKKPPISRWRRGDRSFSPASMRRRPSSISTTRPFWESCTRLIFRTTPCAAAFPPKSSSG